MMRPIQKKARLSPEKRRVQLLDCAMTAFAEAGIERAVHADVAALAGVSVPTVFKYFPTRDKLVDAVLDEVETRILQLIEAVPTATGGERTDQIRQLAYVVEQLCQHAPDLMKVALSWTVAFSSVRPRYLAFHDKSLTLLQKRISGPKDDRTDARILTGAAFLFMQMYFDGSAPDIRERFVTRLSELMR
jgi:TetR/AcrR family hemagglutinin/protease transcriptional regulator